MIENTSSVGEGRHTFGEPLERNDIPGEPQSMRSHRKNWGKRVLGEGIANTKALGWGRGWFGQAQ